jgi:hypothetical protein
MADVRCVFCGWRRVGGLTTAASLAQCGVRGGFRGDEKAESDLDVDLEFVADLTAPGMAQSYTNAQNSLANLCKDMFCATSHDLRISNYRIGRVDHIARNAIECGTEIGVLRKARIVATPPA